MKYNLYKLYKNLIKPKFELVQIDFASLFMVCLLRNTYFMADLKDCFPLMHTIIFNL